MATSRILKPMRIASLSPAITEILFACDLHDRIVCTDQCSNFPDEAREIPHVKDHVNVDPRELQEYEVELVFTATAIQQKLADRLQLLDMPVVHFDPRAINEVYDMIRTLGTMLQVDDKAKELVLSMQQGFNDVKRKAALLPRRLRVYIEEWHDPPFASGNWVPEVARIAGVDQFPIESRALSPQVTLDEIAAWDPDIVVLSPCGAGPHAKTSLITEREGWSVLRAVQEGSVRVLDDSLLNRPGPRLVEGAQRLYGWAFEFLH